MILHRFVGPVILLLPLVGCGPTKPAPGGEVYQGKHVSEWGDAVASGDKNTRIEACKVLVKMGKEDLDGKHAIPGLEKGIKDDDPAIQRWSSVAMVYCSRGTPYPIAQMTKNILIEASQGPDEELRTEAKAILDKWASAPPAPAGGPPTGPPGGPPQGGGNAQGPEEKKTEQKKPPEEGKP